MAIATYNGARYLSEQLESVVGQTYGNLEILVADDGSSDDTVRIIGAFADRYPSIRFWVNDANKGYIKNFEGVIRQCRGEIVFLCDQDDRWEPTKVERHIAAYDDPGVQWVCNRVYMIDGAGAPAGLLEDLAADYYDEKPLAQVAWGRCVIGCATSFRSAPLQRAMPIGRHARAHDSWIQLMFHGQRRVLIDDRLQAYRIHGSNTAGLKGADTDEARRAAMRSHRQLLRELAGDSRVRLPIRAYFLLLYLRRTLGELKRRL